MVLRKKYTGHPFECDTMYARVDSMSTSDYILSSKAFDSLGLGGERVPKGSEAFRKGERLVNYSLGMRDADCV